MDTLLTILRDPIWQFVGAVIALIALIATIKFTKSWLRYVVLSVLIVLIVLICAALFFVYVQKQWDKSNPQNLYVQVTNSNTSLYDPLNEQNANNWDTSGKAGMSCDFKNGAYHASATRPGVIAECLAEATLTSSNFAYQVQMTVLSGDGGGLIFGALGTDASKYRFFIGTGTYYDLFVSVNNENLISGASGVIHAGFNQPNVLTVIVLDNTIYLYINGQFVGKRNTFGNGPISGKIGVFADKFKASQDGSTPADVIYSNVKVWQL